MKVPLIIALSSSLAFSALAQVPIGGGVVICPTCSQETSTIAHIAKTVEEISLVFQLYQQIMIAGQILANMQWSDFPADMANLGAAIQIGQGIAYSAADLDSRFATTFPGFVDATLPYFPQYQAWSQVALDTTYGSLRGHNAIYMQMPLEQAHMDYLTMQNTGAVGEMQAIQTGNQVGIEQLKSLNKLRQVIMTDSQSRQIYQAYEIQKDMAQQNFEQFFFAAGTAGRDGVGW